MQIYYYMGGTCNIYSIDSSTAVNNLNVYGGSFNGTLDNESTANHALTVIVGTCDSTTNLQRIIDL